MDDVLDMTRQEQVLLVLTAQRQRAELLTVAERMHGYSVDYDARSDEEPDSFCKGLDAGVAIGMRLAAQWIERALS